MAIKPVLKKRIALLGIYHETNTFIETSTTLDDFNNGYWLVGNAIRTEYEGANHEISGVIDLIDSSFDMELVPVLYASAIPGGLIQKETYEFILNQMMLTLDGVLPVDGCIVVPHGAGVAESYADMDGHWLTLLRNKLGTKIPVTGTLDPHANVSHAMVAATDALVAYSTNPHIDQFETGRRAATIMAEILRGNISPVQQLIQLPLAISIEQQYTSQEPCKSLYAYVKDLKDQYKLLSISVLLGFPYADVAEMGSAFIIIGDKKTTSESGEFLAEMGSKLHAYMLARKEDFNGRKNEIETLVDSLSTIPKPVLMLDMGDNVGAGSAGNSTYLLEFLEGQNISKIFICIHDPLAIEQACKHQQGDSFELKMGEKGYKSMVLLKQISNGIFTEDTPKHGGFVNYDMGITAIVATAKGNTIMLTTKRTPPYSLRQMTAFGIEPESFDIIIAKGVNAPIAAYAPVCPTIMQVNTPGVTQADMTLFKYKNRRKPMFPFEWF
ncbi:M81 family metallopeptidase [Dyadobacter frigoris]|uniref:M81 family metallopeptidase n=1 Tax=Dyadobacter frigoris TaxID=2576211 RepID=A0A4U6CR04_9BACT|nr:M81 family metallopeptidase [Dyadobacter frigoris]TKT86982.1 M81 family metallopeptidase [Dyadobacter frigoris]